MRRELGMFVALVLHVPGAVVSNPDFLGQSNVDQHHPPDLDARHLRDRHRLRHHHRRDRPVVGSVVGLTGVIIAKLSSPRDRAAAGYSLWVGIADRAGAWPLLIGLAPGAADHAPQPPAVHRHAGRHAAAPRRLADDRRGRHAQPRRLAASSTWPTAASSTIDGDPLLPYPLLDLPAGRRASAAYVLHFTVFGRYVYAIGGNRDAAEYSGIPVKRVETTTYVISAGLGGRRRHLLRRVHRPDVAAGRHRLRALRDRRRRARRLLAARRRGHRPRHRHRRRRSCASSTTASTCSRSATTTRTASARIWRLDPNWTFIIIGARHPARGHPRPGRPHRPGRAPRPRRPRRPGRSRLGVASRRLDAARAGR